MAPREETLSSTIFANRPSETTQIFLPRGGAVSVAMIDEQYLEDAFGGDVDFLQEVIGIYITSSESLIADLKDALTSQDADRARGIAHTFKGSSRSIGANEFAFYCEDLEKAKSWPEVELASQRIILALPELLAACRDLIS